MKVLHIFKIYKIAKKQALISIAVNQSLQTIHGTITEQGMFL
jgi:hypothetical protein